MGIYEEPGIVERGAPISIFKRELLSGCHAHKKC
jgi:hypothetical protein